MQQNIQFSNENQKKQFILVQQMTSIDQAIDYVHDTLIVSRRLMKKVKAEFMSIVPQNLLKIDIDTLMTKEEQAFLLEYPMMASWLFESKYKKVIEELDWEDEPPKTPPKFIHQPPQQSKQQIPLRKPPRISMPSSQKKKLISSQKYDFKKLHRNPPPSCQKKNLPRFRI